LLLAPVIPAVNDREMEQILERAAACGVRRGAWVLLRLPHELHAIFREWLHEHLPERATHVMSLIHQASGGSHYDSRFGHRQSGSGPYADMLAQRFRAACARYGISAGRGIETLDCSRFQPPGPRQLGFCLG
jgi:DNA repair photolyase